MKTEQKEYTVTQISQLIKNTIEHNFERIRIRGEISGLKIASSGHAYFNLKENTVILSATCWKHSVSKLKNPLKEGMEIVAIGKITTYSGQSRYQLSIEDIECDGIGALMKLFLERKAKFEKEGLFEISRKKQIPLYPKIIGIVTSISGSVIQDIIHRISDRFPLDLIIWSTAVQGNQAAQEISNAIIGFNKMKSRKPDVIIVARGGGSVEDLWAFNEEIVIRAVYDSTIPIVSAIGHETDYTLIDFVSDLRAPTPTAAAEFVTPSSKDLLDKIEYLHKTVIQKSINFLKTNSSTLALYSKTINAYDAFILNKVQSIDYIAMNFQNSINQYMLKVESLPSRIVLNTSMFYGIVDIKSMKIKANFQVLQISIKNIYIKYFNIFNQNAILLKSVDYKNVLNRGFVILRVKDSSKIISSIGETKNIKSFSIQLKDGEIEISK